MLTAKAQKEVLKQQCHAMFPYLIDIVNESETDEEELDGFKHYRYANIKTDIEYEGKTYESKCFQLKPFDKKSDGISNGNLNLFDCGLEWIPRIRNSAKRFKMSFVATIRYIDGNNWTLESITKESCTLKGFGWSDDNAISCTMVFDDNMNIVMPVDLMSSVVAPALF